MSPLIFNIMVDAVIRYWRMTIGEVGDLLVSFYADDGLIGGTCALAIQQSIDIFTKGFASLGLKMNASKTEYMTSVGAKICGPLRDEVYARMCTGVGQSFHERRKEYILCQFCGIEIQRASILRHQTLSGRCKSARTTFVASADQLARIQRESLSTATHLDNNPRTFCVSIPDDPNEQLGCPVDGCPYVIRGERRGKGSILRQHFCTRHNKDIITINGEGLLPQCPSCGFFGRNALSSTHRNSMTCKKRTASLQTRKKALDQEAAEGISFTVDGASIRRVTQFKYLGRILDEADNDNHAVDRQLQKARGTWARVGRILSSQTTDARVRGFFYKAILQSVLLYGSETWVITPPKLQLLRSFHHRVARYIVGKHIQELPDGSYVCPPTEEVLEEAGLWPLEEYIKRRRDTINGYVATRPIYERCVQSTALSTVSRRSTWWS